ncbi:helix-turn-helix domain-containing protein [Streptomyces albus subsp. chlorinus]|uniref:helix-turn-helix domain-containing protein n=1 Tax=Streptomyces albus TaxID=1888 RepID=UPI00156DB529|nr:helix-turn-helix transcriptional regulator [Streptomyces albus]NSC24060.1 helix-turn-helix domain-containing protein [Streptomyces albus subsp. chlorinus]
MPPVKPSTVLGRQLGDELRRFRVAAALSTTDAAAVLDCTKGKISRMENGHVPVRLPDLKALISAYGISDVRAQERLTALTRRANRRRRDGWWHQYSSVLSDAYRDQIEMEAICSGIRTFQAQVVPGLLQTAEYARAIAVASPGWDTPEEIEQVVQVRMARQRRLTDEDPMQFWAVLTEGVLHQQVGGPSVMAAQLASLVALADRPNITLQVLPFSRGAHASMLGPYVLLGFPQPAALDLVLSETATGNTWIEREADVVSYQALFDDARTTALPPADSVTMIERIAAKAKR